MGFGEEKKDEDLDISFGGISEDDSKGKIVKFAEVEAEKADAQLDQERSRQQLLSKIARLTETLSDAQQQVQEEKDKRKKKEKSLLKLAKELKKRNLVREKEEDRLEEVRYHWNNCLGKFWGNLSIVCVLNDSNCVFQSSARREKEVLGAPLGPGPERTRSRKGAAL